MKRFNVLTNIVIEVEDSISTNHIYLNLERGKVAANGKDLTDDDGGIVSYESISMEPIEEPIPPTLKSPEAE